MGPQGLAEHVRKVSGYVSLKRPEYFIFCAEKVLIAQRCFVFFVSVYNCVLGVKMTCNRSCAVRSLNI